MSWIKTYIFRVSTSMIQKGVGLLNAITYCVVSHAFGFTTFLGLNLCKSAFGHP